MDAWLQTTLHDVYDLAAHFGCDGETNLPGAAFYFTGIVIQVHEQFYFGRTLKILEGMDIFPLFSDETTCELCKCIFW